MQHSESMFSFSINQANAYYPWGDQTSGNLYCKFLTRQWPMPLVVKTTAFANCSWVLCQDLMAHMTIQQFQSHTQCLLLDWKFHCTFRCGSEAYTKFTVRVWRCMDRVKMLRSALWTPHPLNCWVDPVLDKNCVEDLLSCQAMLCWYSCSYGTRNYLENIEIFHASQVSAGLASQTQFGSIIASGPYALTLVAVNYLKRDDITLKGSCSAYSGCVLHTGADLLGSNNSIFFCNFFLIFAVYRCWGCACSSSRF